MSSISSMSSMSDSGSASESALAVCCSSSPLLLVTGCKREASTLLGSALMSWCFCHAAAFLPDLAHAVHYRSAHTSLGEPIGSRLVLVPGLMALLTIRGDSELSRCSASMKGSSCCMPSHSSPKKSSFSLMISSGNVKRAGQF